MTLPQPILHRPSKSIILPPTYSSLLSEIPRSRMATMCGKSVLQVYHDEGATKKLNEVGFDERLHNANEATVDALGHTERSSHKENMIPMDTLGALVVESDKFGVFQIGTGFDDSLRKWIWENRSDVWGNL